MSITIHCECGVKLQVKDEYAGQEGRCPKCGRSLYIPRHDDPPAVVPVEEDPVPLISEAHEVNSRDRQREDRDDRDERNRREEAPDVEQGEVQDHGGEPLPSSMYFFKDPPKKLGAIVSACSTLSKGVEPWSASSRAVLVLFIGGLGMAVGLMITLGARLRDPFWAAFWPILLTSVFALIAWACTIFSHTVTYVCAGGLARYGCTGTRDSVSSTEVFPFADAQHLRTHTVLHYTNGTYQHTAYTYTWSDINGTARFAITGQHNSETGSPTSQHAFHFARAGEIAWTIFLLNQVDAQLSSNGHIQFALTGGDWIRLGKDSIQFRIGGNKDEWTIKEISQVSVQAGMVQLRHREAKEGWFSSSGIIKFQYDQLANAQLFFHVMERYVGIPVT